MRQIVSEPQMHQWAADRLFPNDKKREGAWYEDVTGDTGRKGDATAWYEDVTGDTDSDDDWKKDCPWNWKKDCPWKNDDALMQWTHDIANANNLLAGKLCPQSPLPKKMPRALKKRLQAANLPERPPKLVPRGSVATVGATTKETPAPPCHPKQGTDDDNEAGNHIKNRLPTMPPKAVVQSVLDDWLQLCREQNKENLALRMAKNYTMLGGFPGSSAGGEHPPVPCKEEEEPMSESKKRRLAGVDIKQPTTGAARFRREQRQKAEAWKQQWAESDWWICAVRPRMASSSSG